MNDSVGMVEVTGSSNAIYVLDTGSTDGTYEKLQDERTGLYFQSPVYVYDFFQKELKNGKLSI